VSYEAVRWAMSQAVLKSSAKFVLVAMADCVNGQGGQMTCWPTVAHLCTLTALDRKTVIDGLHRLRDSGWIRDTGERRGATGQVPVYELKTPESGTVKTDRKAQPEPAKSPESPTPNGPESGTDTETGTVPLSEANSPVFPHEQSRFSLETVPKTGHGTRKEQGKNKEGTRKKGSFDAGGIELPDWLDAETWQSWCRDRASRGKRITEDAARLQLRKLAEYREQGHEPATVIEHCIANGYQGLFPPSGPKKPATPSGKHSGFAAKNYREGVEADGSFH
jgi:hypothetical protein